jgi:hypothetical protein
MLHVTVPYVTCNCALCYMWLCPMLHVTVPYVTCDCALRYMWLCLWIVQSWLPFRFSLTYIYYSFKVVSASVKNKYDLSLICGCFEPTSKLSMVCLSTYSPEKYLNTLKKYTPMLHSQIEDFQPHMSWGSSWQWSYGRWIYNYLCNQWLSPQKLWVRTLFMARYTWYNIMW